ncbi:MAG: amidohydrolase family protein, partial [Bacteroidales bacterium]|nr:amidohydrolase family protein [Bacteroidales bacterium]
MALMLSALVCFFALLPEKRTPDQEQLVQNLSHLYEVSQAMMMATRLGAAALGLGDVTGSLEVGKRADLIVVDGEPLHNTPQFTRDPDALYARIVYAGKSTDVVDV